MPTSPPPTEPPVPEVKPYEYDIEVTFDGQQCFVAVHDVSIGPKEILFTNTSGMDAYPYICRLDPDKSWADNLEYAGSLGTFRPIGNGCRTQGGSLTGKDGDSDVYSVFLVEGRHVMVCEPREDNVGTWLGAGFWIH
jgi:hypothetical protein